ncbi:MAG: hypothetical protein WBA76_17700 [Phormidesmis sp.]
MKDSQIPVEDPIENPSSSGSDGAVRSILKDIDAIIRIKRQQRKTDVEADITDAERQDVVARYKQLEEIKENRKGRFLLEYDRGLRTLVEEVVP